MRARRENNIGSSFKYQPHQIVSELLTPQVINSLPCKHACHGLMLQCRQLAEKMSSALLKGDSKVLSSEPEGDCSSSSTVCASSLGVFGRWRSECCIAAIFWSHYLFCHILSMSPFLSCWPLSPQLCAGCMSSLHCPRFPLVKPRLFSALPNNRLNKDTSDSVCKKQPPKRTEKSILFFIDQYQSANTHVRLTHKVVPIFIFPSDLFTCLNIYVILLRRRLWLRGCDVVLLPLGWLARSSSPWSICQSILNPES